MQNCGVWDFPPNFRTIKKRYPPKLAIWPYKHLPTFFHSFCDYYTHPSQYPFLIFVTSPTIFSQNYKQLFDTLPALLRFGCSNIPCFPTGLFGLPRNAVVYFSFSYFSGYKMWFVTPHHNHIWIQPSVFHLFCTVNLIMLYFNLKFVFILHYIIYLILFIVSF